MVRITQRITLFAGLILVLGAPIPVRAQAELNSGHTAASRCERAAAAVSSLAKVYQGRAAASEEALGRVRDRLVNIIGRADARGYDVAQLQTDQTELERRIAGIKANYAEVIKAVNSSKPMCAADGSLKPAREALAKLRNDVSGLRQWWPSTLQTDLAKLKAARPKE